MGRRVSAGLILAVLASVSGCGSEKALSEPGEDAGVFNANSIDAAPVDTSSAPSGWTNRTAGTPASKQEWMAVASDASGQHLVAVSSTVDSPGNLVSGVWASTDGGSTWAHVGDRNGHASVAASSTGTVFIVAGGWWLGGDEPIWALTYSGTAWALNEFPLDASSVASDATGTHFVAGSDTGDIMTSSDSGATWTNQTPSGPAHDQNWISVASSSTGTKLVALSGGMSTSSCTGYCPPAGDIWTSSDSGVTWIDRTPTGAAHDARWMSVASDASGMNLVAVGEGVWTSADAGLTWTQQTAPSDVSSADLWTAVASDATGKRLIAATYGDSGTGGGAGGGGGLRPARYGSIFTSTNAGVTWTNETAGTAASDQNWVAVASDSLGVHFVAIADYGDIWTN